MIKMKIMLYLSLLIACNVVLPTAMADVIVVQNNAVNADIMIDPNASTQITDAADTLAEYIEKSTTATLSVLTSGGAQPNKIHVGDSTYVSGLSLDLSGLDDDGYLINFPDANNIVIIGKTEWGTEFGVYEFLERYVGVRWLMPGVDGEHVPTTSTLSTTSTNLQHNPVFFTREISGLPNATQDTWARRNRMHSRIRFHHNLLNLFPVSIYGPSGTNPHTEFYPILAGQTYIPSSDTDRRWQPRFTATDLVSEAVDTIDTYFTANPTAFSYSLGVNSSGRFSEDEWVSGTNYLGYNDYSDVYFNWANAVVSGVLATHPDKTFGCLAYINVAGAPTVSVHSNLIPYLCSDRMKWCDSTVETNEKAVNAQWAAKASVLGWYDYAYGALYLVPRIYPNQMASYYRYAKDNNVRHLYTEAYPNWGEGPKFYTMLKLQWDPDLIVDDVLDEWYTLAVGGDPNTSGTAAYDLKQYYDLWEDFWTNRVLTSSWFTSSSGSTYLDFLSPTYLDVVTLSDITQSRTLLESVVAKASTTAQQNRASLILSAFEYYEASALSYFEIDDVLTTQNALDVLDNIDIYAYKRYLLFDQFASDPVLEHPLSPVAMTDSTIYELMQWTDDDPAVKQHVQDIVSLSKWASLREEAAIMLDIVDKVYDRAGLYDPSFEDPASSWTHWAGSGGTLARSTVDAYSGTSSYLFTCADSTSVGGPYQEVFTNVQGGKYILSSWVKAEGTDGTVELAVTALTATGVSIQSYYSPHFTVQSEEWTHIWYVIDIPDSINGQQVGGVRFFPCIVRDYEANAKVYIDEGILSIGPSVYDEVCLYMPLEEGEGIATEDFSLNSNDATISNAGTSATWTTGQVGQALKFTSSEHVVITHDDSLKPGASGTVEFWYKSDGWASQYTSLVARGDALDLPTSASEAWNVFNDYANDDIIFAIGDGVGNSDSISISPRPSTGVWHHYAFTFNGTELKSYLDGVLKSTVTQTVGTINQADLATYLGQVTPVGTIDEVMIRANALSADEISEQYIHGYMGGYSEIDEDSSFEDSASPWTKWAGSGGTLVRSTDDSHSADTSYLFTCASTSSVGGPFQVVYDVQGGKFALSAWVKTDGTAGTVGLAVTALTDVGSSIKSYYSPSISLQTGEWTYISYVIDIPDVVNSKQVGGVRFFPCIVRDYEANAKVYIDEGEIRYQ